MTEVALFSQKLRKFGAVGVGVIPDALTTLQFAEAAQSTQDSEKEPAEAAQRELNLCQTPSAAPSALAPKAAGEKALKQSSTVDGKTLSRDEILKILDETVRVQAIVQHEVSLLARKLVKEKNDKKKKKVLSFTDGHKKIQELNLPMEPLEEYGIEESTFQRILLEYEEDDEVMHKAQKLLHPAGKGDAERAKGITIQKIIDIHEFMVKEMAKVLEEFLQHPQEVRRSFTSKGCETTAELLVSVAVEQQMAVRCEDVEQAVIQYEDSLQMHPEFTRCTEQLATMMQHLIGAVQPRVGKAEFLRILQFMGENQKNAKVFSKKLYEDYRGKTCSITEAYQRFEAFNDQQEQAQAALNEAGEMTYLNPVELQLCYDEYHKEEEVRSAWEKSGAENSIAMQNIMGGLRNPSSSSSSPAEDKKGKKLKSSEIVSMQELMVDELKRTTEAAGVALALPNASSWRAEVAVQLVQSLASAAVERRYGVSAEEMTLAGFQHAATLQRNERFMRATEKQQEILMQLPGICKGGAE